LVLAIVDHELSATFSFTARGHNHHIDPDDILVVVGYEDKIAELTALMGGKNG
jgi:Trk K+ transport system NAD-binding subunit